MKSKEEEKEGDKKKKEREREGIWKVAFWNVAEFSKKDVFGKS